MFSHIFVIVGIVWFGRGGVEGLEDYDNFSEGACLDQRAENQNENVDTSWLDSLNLISGGSKYHMFKMASAHPRYDTMKEDEFYYDFCFRRNVSAASSAIRETYGFGRVLESWDIRSRPDIPGLYVEATPRSFFPRNDVLQHRISLTDNKSFAFLLNCFVAANEKAWNIISSENLSEEAIRIIEEHAISLGFNPKNFVFLRYDSCQNNTFPGLPRAQQRRDNRDEGRWERRHPPKKTGWNAAPSTTKWTPPPTLISNYFNLNY